MCHVNMMALKKKNQKIQTLPWIMRSCNTLLVLTALRKTSYRKMSLKNDSANKFPENL